MADPNSVLNDLLRDRQSTASTKTFTDMSKTEIVTKKGFKYHLQHVTDSTVNMNAGCTRLTLDKCKNITIVAEKFPIMGINISQTDNTRMDIAGTPPKSGAGFLSLDHSVIGTIESDQDCMVEVNESCGIVLNGTNISDQYHDSTWKISS